MNKKKTNL